MSYGLDDCVRTAIELFVHKYLTVYFCFYRLGICKQIIGLSGSAFNQERSGSSVRKFSNMISYHYVLRFHRQMFSCMIGHDDNLISILKWFPCDNNIDINPIYLIYTVGQFIGTFFLWREIIIFRLHHLSSYDALTHIPPWGHGWGWEECLSTPIRQYE